MASQESDLSIPSKWQERFLLKRIQEDDIELTLEERNAILQTIEEGSRFIQIRKYTIMVNTIKSIDPYWGDENIPPKPKPKEVVETTQGSTVVTKVTNQDELDLWEKLFGKKALKDGEGVDSQ